LTIGVHWRFFLCLLVASSPTVSADEFAPLSQQSQENPRPLFTPSWTNDIHRALNCHLRAKITTKKKTNINQTSYLPLSGNFNPGSLVLDLQLHATAFITHRIVVLPDLSNENPVTADQLQLLFKEIATVKIIASNVFEISFLHTDIDMYEQYKKLKNAKGIDRVELIIFYSGHNGTRSILQQATT